MNITSLNIISQLDLAVRTHPLMSIDTDALLAAQRLEESIRQSSAHLESLMSAATAAAQLDRTIREAWARFDSVQEQFHRSFEQIQRQLTEACSFIAPVWFEEELEYSAAALEPSARQLGLLGWTVPLWEHPGFARMAIRESQEEIDNFFIAAYSVDEAAQFQSLATDLRGRACLSTYRDLIGECIQSYLAGRYRVIIPNLLLVLEGVVAIAGDSVLRLTPVPQITTKLHVESRFFRRVLWASIDGFVQKVFESRHFRFPRPDVINRNWVLHGRDSSDWTQADALRLFQALDTLSHIVESDLRQPPEPEM